MQTLFAPAVTSLLFLVVFTIALGRGASEINGVGFSTNTETGLYGKKPLGPGNMLNGKTWLFILLIIFAFLPYWHGHMAGGRYVLPVLFIFEEENATRPRLH